MNFTRFIFLFGLMGLVGCQQEKDTNTAVTVELFGVDAVTFPEKPVTIPASENKTF